MVVGTLIDHHVYMVDIHSNGAGLLGCVTLLETSSSALVSAQISVFTCVRIRGCFLVTIQGKVGCYIMMPQQAQSRNWCLAVLMNAIVSMMFV